MTIANVNVRQILLKRGNTTQSTSYTGPVGELTLDTDLDTVRVHDGVTAGGVNILATQAQIDALTTTISTITGVDGNLLANAATQQTQINNITSGVTLFGNIIPSANVTYSLGNVTYQWKEIWVSNSTIYLGGTPLSVVDGNLYVNGNAVSGNSSSEGSGPVQPYLQVTDTPFITQPVVLGEPVTVTAAPWGINAQVQVDILDGSVLGGVTVTQPGTGYVVGQNYIIWSYQIGGPMPTDSLTLTIDTVDENGGILTVTNVQFLGAQGNATGSYGGVSIEYQPSVFDEIDVGLVLTRGVSQGIFNIDAESEYDNNTYLSPLGTEWNADGWGNLLELGTRSYTTWRSALNNQVGNNIVGAELVMHDTVNDKYYKFDFTAWGGNDGGYSYTRTLVEDPNYFRKTDGGDEVDVIVQDDGAGAGIGITRGVNNSIYNPYREEGYDQDTSPVGTLWNIDGWDDLSNIETRTYTNFYAAYNGQLGNRVPGSKAVMYVPETNTYYAVQWYNWTPNGGGGFSYYRRELDLTKLNEGVKFPDGTVLKSAEGVGRVKSTTSGDRRIEEAVGNNTVSVTSITEGVTQLATIRDTSNSWDFYVDATPELTQLYDTQANFRYLEFSFDGGNTWIKVNFGGGQYEVYYQMVFEDNVNRPVTAEDAVSYRVVTGGESVVWWDKADLPGGSDNFRGAVIDYHAYSGEATWIGTIHIVSDTGNEYITHTEVNSGSTDAENDDLWLVTQEGQIRYRRIDGEAKTLKVHWTAKIFYGSEFWD